MQTQISTACILVLIVATTLGAADDPFVGTWKLNLAKSQLPGQIVIQEAGQGSVYVQPPIFGTRPSWKSIGPRSWEVVSNERKLKMTHRLTISDDEKTLTVTAEGVRPYPGISPEGSIGTMSFQSTTVYARASGGLGLGGTWRPVDLGRPAPAKRLHREFDSSEYGPVEESSSEVMKITPYQDDGLAISSADFCSSWSGKLNGSDYSCGGDNSPRGMTLARTRADQRRIKLVIKMNGKPVYRGSEAVSSDGKTLTRILTRVAVDKSSTNVYDSTKVYDRQ